MLIIIIFYRTERRVWRNVAYIAESDHINTNAENELACELQPISLADIS